MEIILLEKKKILNEAYSFIFEKPKDFDWKSGQYAKFRHHLSSDSAENDYRIFTISSSPKENKIVFTTLINENLSPFKQKLMQLQKGDTISIEGPFGEFTLNPDKKRIIGITGGIGITPFKSLIYDLENNKMFSNIKLNLIYSAKENNFYFKDYLENIQRSNIKIIYTPNREQTKNELIDLINVFKNDSIYYISGKPMMVNSIRKILIENKILEKNIKSDQFDGYN
jgi:NAD(P)H-flavin reductase